MGANIPIANILVKDACSTEHITHISHFANIPTANILVKYIRHQYIGDWDVSNVTDMQYMFSNANAFNLDISSWDVSKVTNMEWMFIDGITSNICKGVCYNRNSNIRMFSTWAWRYPNGVLSLTYFSK
jgi:surface protein